MEIDLELFHLLNLILIKISFDYLDIFSFKRKIQKILFFKKEKNLDAKREKNLIYFLKIDSKEVMIFLKAMTVIKIRI